MTEKLSIAPASGRLGVLTPGLGAVATTFIAGVIAARQGLAVPIGSVSQMAHIRLGRRNEGRNPLIRDFVPLANLDDLVFGGWDPISSNVLEAARTCGVLDEKADFGSGDIYKAFRDTTSVCSWHPYSGNNRKP